MAKKKKNLKENVQNATEQDSEKLLSQEDASKIAPSANIDQSVSNKEETEADELRDKQQELDLKEVTSITDDALQKELKRFLIPKLRSASYRWAERSKAIKNARVARGLYKCAMCGDSTLKNGQFVMDHKAPVVPFEGWNGTDWTQYITRMFVKAEDFQALCNTCHDLKTDSEVQIRKFYREKKKKEKNS